MMKTISPMPKCSSRIAVPSKFLPSNDRAAGFAAWFEKSHSGLVDGRHADRKRV